MPPPQTPIEIILFPPQGKSNKYTYSLTHAQTHTNKEKILYSLLKAHTISSSQLTPLTRPYPSYRISKFAAADGHHSCRDREGERPETDLRVGVDTREPQTRRVLKAVGVQMNMFLQHKRIILHITRECTHTGT